MVNWLQAVSYGESFSGFLNAILLARSKTAVHLTHRDLLLVVLRETPHRFESGTPSNSRPMHRCRRERSSRSVTFPLEISDNGTGKGVVMSSSLKDAG